MRLVIGLGNPEGKFQSTRHNVGFLVVEKLQKSSRVKFPVIKSGVSMNISGNFVVREIKKRKLSPEDLFIIHDDLDIPLGSFKIQFAKGPKDHNGLNDIYEKLKTNDFWHVRVGIENRPSDNKKETSGREYVLQEFTSKEKKIIEQVIERICKKLEIL